LVNKWEYNGIGGALDELVGREGWLLIFQNPPGCSCPPQIILPGLFANSPQFFGKHNPDVSTLFGFG
jgi:hypothetical protein